MPEETTDTTETAEETQQEQQAPLPPLHERFNLLENKKEPEVEDDKEEPPGPKEDESAEEKPSVEDRKLSRAFAALSRKEKSLRDKETRYKQQISALDEKVARLEKIEKGFLEGDPIEALQALGLDFDELSKRVLNGGKQSSEHRIAALEKERAEEKRLRLEMEEHQKIREQSENVAKAEAEHKGYIKEYLERNKEDFQNTIGNGAENDVFEVIRQHFVNTFDENIGAGEILSIEDAAELCEQYYLSVAERKKAKTEKSKPAPKKEEPERKQPNSGTTEKPKPRTLSNKSVAATPSRTTRQATLAERKQAAIRALEEAGGITL